MRYEEKLKEIWENRRGVDWEGIDEEWVCLRDSIKICAEDLYGKKKVGGVRRKGSEWWI